MRSLFYFIKEALINSKKNFSTTLGAILTIFLSLLVIGVFLVASLVIDKIIQSVESQVTITIWLADEAVQSDIDALRGFIQNLPEVSEVTYTSKDEAIEKFKEMSDTEIVEQLGGNPLPASLDVSLVDPEQVESVVDQISAQQLFTRVIDRPDNPADSLRYGQKIIKQLFMIAEIIRYVCIALVALLAFVALIFINNTIRLAILARRKEIAIMRLVGASNGFIRGPFLMEGALQAIVGAGLAAGSIALVCHYLLPRVTQTISWLPVDFTGVQLWQIYLLLFGVGLIIGLFGSAWAMRRYLKV
jgi:cell division transport system permease protein